MKKLIYSLFVLFFITSCQNSNLTEKEKFIDDLISQMTLAEKAGQMNQYNGFWDATGPMPEGDYQKKRYNELKNGQVGSMLNVIGVEEIRALQKIAVEETRLGIPLIFGHDVIHGYKTMFPIPLAESSSWDLELLEKSARIAATEASADGLNWTFAPMVDISRDARWGRVMEGAGEDPFLGSLIAKARVKGFQGDNLSEVNTIVACAKHFAGYGFSEAGRDYNTTDFNQYTLHNTIMPPFKAAVEAGVRTFMNSFNTLDEIPATGNKHIQRDILKGDWNFDGFIVSDWGSIDQMIPHGFASNGEHAAELALIAGSDMDMESSLYVSKLVGLVESGKVKEELLDDAVRRILRVKYELGLFEDPYKYCDQNRSDSELGSEKNMMVALDAAKKSIVLLKNDNQLLPLKKQNQKIAIIGQLANDKNSTLGNWRSQVEYNSAVSVVEGMKKYKGNKTIYQKGVDLYYGETNFHNRVKINFKDKSDFGKAKLAAATSDIVIMVLGEEGHQSGEGRSRTNIDLPGLQKDLLKEIKKVNKNIVLVVMSGRPLDLSWEDENIPAIVQAWQLGSRSGNAIAQVLYGDYNPSGKLTMSFPRNVGQVPVYYNFKNTGRPSTSIEQVTNSGYADVENSPLYPFGYGLSYTNFTYSDLTISSDSMTRDSKIYASVTISNTGSFNGEEVVQLYLRDIVGSIARPMKELKGFKKIELNPGESKTVNFEIDNSLLEFYSFNNIWESELGKFHLFIGTDSNVSNYKEFYLVD
ncbi:MAG: beta-glucosidase BglX [Flavobacteriaceae bacterium]|nr:beta-glucosidase BglX [Flavobacteriaceae bacterium]MAU30501.1 beta-glucosidase BglX [Flavobacteriaceae bacterium]|tara:strand:- start:13384 stop:15645 length:2262 start_codon:yes stop_codon:yes gene_type:complete